MNRRHIVFTSDWHIGHKNVLNFCNRPYDNVEDMAKAFITNYNKNTYDSTVGYFLGDMGMCSQQVLKNVVDQLNGTKILILGNHDRGMQSMYNAGFDAVLYNATIMIDGVLVTMSHCPLKGIYREDTSKMKKSGGNWHGELSAKYHKFTIDGKDEFNFHLHGHIHSPNGGKSVKIEGRQFDVGVDANKFRPVQMGEIESWIRKELNK